MRGLGKWASAVARSTRPKSRRKSSRGKSLLSKKDEVSHPRESAVVHSAQMSLLDYGDRVKMGDNEPAVENTVEKLTVRRIDTTPIRQEKDTRSAGGQVG